MVRVTGLEPAYLTAPEPKSGVSANFTTPAYLRIYYIIKLLKCQCIKNEFLPFSIKYPIISNFFQDNKNRVYISFI